MSAKGTMARVGFPPIVMANAREQTIISLLLVIAGLSRAENVATGNTLR